MDVFVEMGPGTLRDTFSFGAASVRDVKDMSYFRRLLRIVWNAKIVCNYCGFEFCCCMDPKDRL